MKLVVGLGNPGPKYEGTRHNIGYAVLDYLATGPNVGSWRGQFQGQLALLADGAEQVLLMKPETFMNLSGRAVRQAVDFYKLSVADLLVVCDDLALPLGKLRIRARGSHGGQNGLRNIQEMLGTPDYARLRIGIDPPGEHWDAADYVLSRFKPGERAVVANAVALAAEAVLVWVRSGIEVCMNRFNGEPLAPPAEKPKKPKSNSETAPNKNKSHPPPTDN